MKREKHSFAEFYLLPIRDGVVNFWKDALKELFGWWYCYGCEKMHGPRTVQYEKWIPTKSSFVPLVPRCVCSLHKDQERDTP